MTITEAQKQVDDWIKRYGVRYFNELTNICEKEHYPFEKPLHNIYKKC